MNSAVSKLVVKFNMNNENSGSNWDHSSSSILYATLDLKIIRRYKNGFTNVLSYYFLIEYCHRLAG